jgi:ribosomal protein S6--L-glutamate ligase
LRGPCTGDYFVSLHHRIRLDRNIRPIGPLSREEAGLVKGAAGVLMPKYCPPSRYRQVASLARSHFPHLGPRFEYRGKARQTRLFRRLGIPHPDTVIYSSPGEALCAGKIRFPPRPLPFVLKGDTGGGGSAVFPVASRADYLDGLGRLPAGEPVLVQEWIANGGKDLRVVLMGKRVKSYFRVGGESFYNNVSRGARIDYDLLPALQREGRDTAIRLARMTGIDLGAFDIMFPAGGGPPLLIEINFFFGRKGLGGLEGYESMFMEAVNDWMLAAARAPIRGGPRRAAPRADQGPSR